MPNDENTPPGGNRRVKPMTEHAMIGLGELGKRTADKVQELSAEWRAAKPHIEELPKMRMMLELALRPTIQPVYVSRAVAAGAISLGIIAACFVIFTVALVARVSIAPAFADVPKVQQQRR